MGMRAPLHEPISAGPATARANGGAGSALEESTESAPAAGLRCPRDRSFPVDSQFPLLHHGLPDAGGQLRARARQTAALGKSPLARAGSAVRAGAGAWVAVHPCTGLPDPHFLPGVPRTLCTGVHSQCRIYRGWASRRMHWGRNSARLACEAVAGAGYGCAACRTLPARECWLAALAPANSGAVPSIRPGRGRDGKEKAPNSAFASPRSAANQAVLSGCVNGHCE